MEDSHSGGACVAKCLETEHVEFEEKKTDEGRVHDSSRIIYVFRSFDNIEKKRNTKTTMGIQALWSLQLVQKIFSGITDFDGQSVVSKNILRVDAYTFNSPRQFEISSMHCLISRSLFYFFSKYFALRSITIGITHIPFLHALLELSSVYQNLLRRKIENAFSKNTLTAILFHQYCIKCLTHFF